MPYVNEMILSFGVNENDVGIWSAIAVRITRVLEISTDEKESSFMATEAVIAPFYAPIGDKYGRRPVVLVLIAFWGMFAMGFGLSGSVITAVVMRGCRESLVSRYIWMTDAQLGCLLG
jgi:MFS family permease